VGLAYQRVPGTLVLIDRPFLEPNPFDAEPSDPIALVPARLTGLGAQAARQLRLPLRGPADGTVRWHTQGLSAALAGRRAERNQPVGAWRAPWIPPRGFRERVDRVGGLVRFTANPSVLKENAVQVSALGDYAFAGMDYAEIDWPNGEVQVFRDYRRRVSAARVARRELLTEPAGALAPEDLKLRSGPAAPTSAGDSSNRWARTPSSDLAAVCGCGLGRTSASSVAPGEGVCETARGGSWSSPARGGSAMPPAGPLAQLAEQRTLIRGSWVSAWEPVTVGSCLCPAWRPQQVLRRWMHSGDRRIRWSTKVSVS
jgi:hypothetical protein